MSHLIERWWSVVVSCLMEHLGLSSALRNSMGWRWILLQTPMVMTHKGQNNPSFITKHSKDICIFIGFPHSGRVRVSIMTMCESKQSEFDRGGRGEGGGCLLGVNQR